MLGHETVGCSFFKRTTRYVSGGRLRRSDGAKISVSDVSEGVIHVLE